MIAALAVATIVLVGCSSEVSSASAATVAGTDIPRSQLEEAVTTITDRAGTLEDADAESRADIVAPMQRQLLSLFVQAEIIEDVADERGITVDDQAITDQIEADTAEIGGEDEFEQTLAQSQLTLPVYRDVLLPAQQRVEAIRTSLQEDLPDTEVRTARHILVDDADEAQEIVDLLDEGADFAELAEQRSTDPGSGAQGGDLGPAPRGSYVDAFEQAVWESELNEVVGPVETEFGFHILEVTDESVLSGDEVDPATQAQTLDRLLTELLQTSFGEADVQVASAFGTWDGDLGEVVEDPAVGSGD
jgi:parvulin-like peptidyl-prolyl isomerase